eukprot:29091-Pelagococcus_subviridis.AAC.1
MSVARDESDDTACALSGSRCEFVGVWPRARSETHRTAPLTSAPRLEKPPRRDAGRDGRIIERARESRT